MRAPLKQLAFTIRLLGSMRIVATVDVTVSPDGDQIAHIGSGTLVPDPGGELGFTYSYDNWLGKASALQNYNYMTHRQAGEGSPAVQRKFQCPRLMWVDKKGTIDARRAESILAQLAAMAGSRPRRSRRWIRKNEHSPITKMEELEVSRFK